MTQTLGAGIIVNHMIDAGSTTELVNYISHWRHRAVIAHRPMSRPALPIPRRSRNNTNATATAFRNGLHGGREGQCHHLNIG